VLEPIPTFPFASTVKSDVPDDDATLNGLVAGAPCTLKVYEEDVALIPATVPLSILIPVPTVVGESQRVTNPVVPPERLAEGAPQYIIPAPSTISACPAEPNCPGSVKVRFEACVEEEISCVVKLFDAFAK
jgi:hypothetical protein